MDTQYLDGYITNLVYEIEVNRGRLGGAARMPTVASRRLVITGFSLGWADSPECGSESSPWVSSYDQHRRRSGGASPFIEMYGRLAGEVASNAPDT